MNPETPSAAQKENICPPPPDGTASQLSPLNSQLLVPAKGESERAFEAFRVYLELGPKRRFSAVVRKVGASRRTVRRWASAFSWRDRIKAHAAQCAETYTETAAELQREEILDTAARNKAFRERQYAVAEGLLDAAERYLDSMDFDDLDQMDFADACKALEVASRIFQQRTADAVEDPSADAITLRNQLTTLLDQAYDQSNGKPVNA